MEQPVRIKRQQVVGIPQHRLPKRAIEEFNVRETKCGDRLDGRRSRYLSAAIR